MTSQAIHLWTITDELNFMRDFSKWNLSAINSSRNRMGVPELATRQDAFRQYARGLRRRVRWDDMKKRVPACADRPERFDPLTNYDIEKLVDAAQEIVAQFDDDNKRFPCGRGV